MRSKSPSAWILTFVLLLAACGKGGTGQSLPLGSADLAPEVAPDPALIRAIQGNVIAASFTKVDSDINNPAQAAVSNNTRETAQDLPSQFRLGGYVNKKGAGPDGASRSSGDEQDFIKVQLAKGQVINLFVGNPDEGDLDLLLYLDSGELAGFSVSATSNVESVVVPILGVYFIEVAAFSGSGNYVLATGNAPVAPHALQSGADLIAGQVVAALEQTDQAPLTQVTAKSLKAAGLHKIGGLMGQPQLFRLDGHATAKSRETAAAALPHWATVPPALAESLATAMAIKYLAKTPGIAYAEPNLRRRALRLPDDPQYRLQSWHYEQIGLPQAWDVTIGSPEVLVAVIDTGVLVNHPDLIANLDRNDPDGFDFISDPLNALDGDGRDDNGADPGDAGDGPTASSFHGTHVAGTISATGNNGRGVTGVNWNAQIMPLRALGALGGESFDIIQALRYAAGLPNDSGKLPVKRADIVNLSLGGGFFSQAEQDAVNQVRAQGVIVIASAGNDGQNFLPSALSFPAAYDSVVSVAATDISRDRATYSQFNSAVDVAAPGGDTSTDLNSDGIADGVFSTHGSDAGRDGMIGLITGPENGTSMSAPHVSGVAALMKAVHPQLTPAQFDQLLQSGEITDDLGAPGRDIFFGYGLINAANAITAAQRLAGVVPPMLTNPTLKISPAGINFGVGVEELDIVLSNAGPDPLSVNSVTDNQPWLSITPLAVDSNGIGTYRLRANRTTLPAGPYAATVTAVSSANTLSVPVFMEVPTPDILTESNVGHLYLSLHDALTNEAVARTEADVSSGRYAFRFNEVPDGKYYVVATTDRDNDQLVCDPGEACGRFPADFGDITVSGSGLSGFTFPVTFDQAITVSEAQ